jgi:hypothetical protein
MSFQTEGGWLVFRFAREIRVCPDTRRCLSHGEMRASLRASRRRRSGKIAAPLFVMKATERVDDAREQAMSDARLLTLVAALAIAVLVAASSGIIINF